MNKIAFGSYYNTNSIIHKIDPRIKIIAVILFMVSLFLIPMYNLWILLGFVVFTLLIILLTRVPFLKYLKSIRHVFTLLIFTFVFQLIFRTEGKLIYTFEMNFTVLNIVIVSLIFLLFLIFFRFLKFRILIFLTIATISLVLFHFNIFNQNILKTINVHIYDEGLFSSIFIVVRVLVLIMFSNVLTLTTKSTDLNNAIESLLKPLELLKIKTSIFSMMVSIALRFIPTLFIEMDRILKAQASRGSDFNEGNLVKKIKQVISILIPMFIISFKRADDLSLAMEARGYVPGNKRTKLNVLKMRIYDYFILIFFNLLLVGLILLRVL